MYVLERMLNLLLMKIKFFLGVRAGGFSRLAVPLPNEMKKAPSSNRNKY
jgi:hypothetical protein